MDMHVPNGFRGDDVDYETMLEEKYLKEMTDHPKHYNMGRYEVIDVIEDWKLGFNLGNAIKYIARADHKGKRLEDLFKAKWYIEREIALEEENGG